MPQEFIEQSMDNQDGTFAKLFVGGMGIFGSALTEKAGVGKLSYQVYRCPACRCKVLVSSMKQGNSTNEEIAGKISNCR